MTPEGRDRLIERLQSTQQDSALSTKERSQLGQVLHTEPVVKALAAIMREAAYGVPNSVIQIDCSDPNTAIAQLAQLQGAAKGAFEAVVGFVGMAVDEDEETDVDVEVGTSE